MATFDISHPNLSYQWISEYYAKYEYQKDEEKFLLEWKNGILDSYGKSCEYYQEFLETFISIFDTYDKICMDEAILPLFHLSDYFLDNTDDIKLFRNDRVLYMKIAAISVFIDVLERTKLLKKIKVSQYLESSCYEKLTLLEMESGNLNFQTLAILQVELHNDFENILNFNKGSQHSMSHMASRIDEEISPFIPSWLTPIISDFRKMHTDDELRRDYQRISKYLPFQSWPCYIIERAMFEGMVPLCYLATDYDNPQELKKLYMQLAKHYSHRNDKEREQEYLNNAAAIC